MKSANKAFAAPKSAIVRSGFSRALNEYRSEIGVGIGLVLFMIIMSFASPYFLTSTNLINVLSQVAIIGVLAIGQTYVILTGGIDLSVGAVFACAAMYMGMVMETQGIGAGIAVALLIGLMAGLVNGVLVGYVKLAPFIVTLGMMSIARSQAYISTDGTAVTKLPPAFALLGDGRLFGVPYYIYVTVALFIIGAAVLTGTKLGRYLYAIGSNEQATRLSGVNVSLYKTMAYVISGLMAAIAAIIQTSRLMAVDPTFGNGYELDTIAAVVIGGTSLMGGSGTLIGTAIGVLLIGFLRNGLNLIGVSPFWQGTAIGTVIILALVIERFTRRDRG